MKNGVPGVSGYQGPAGGWGAVKAVTASVFSQKPVARDIIAMFKMNQVKRFDWPGCAWPDPGHLAPMELCENGVKAVTWETTSKKAYRSPWQKRSYCCEFFASERQPLR